MDSSDLMGFSEHYGKDMYGEIGDQQQVEARGWV